VECPKRPFSHIRTRSTLPLPATRSTFAKGTMRSRYDSQAGLDTTRQRRCANALDHATETRRASRRRSHRTGCSSRIPLAYPFLDDRRWRHIRHLCVRRRTHWHFLQNASGGLDHIAVRNFKLAHHSMVPERYGRLCASGNGGAQVSKSTIATVHDSRKRYHCDEKGTVTHNSPERCPGLGQRPALRKWRSDWIRRRCSITTCVTNNVWAPCTA